MKQAKGFDSIAFCYDFFKKLVFGKSLKRAEAHLLQKDQTVKHCLVIGAGSGDILNILMIQYPNSRITCVDFSHKMIEKAKVKTEHLDGIRFVCDNLINYEMDRRYEVIVLPYVLSCIRDSYFKQISEKIMSAAYENSIIYFTDFVINTRSLGYRWLSISLMKILYLFFNLTCNLGLWRYPNYTKLFVKTRFKLISESSFYFNNVITRSYSLRTK